MPTETTKYVLKDLGPQVPLIDPKTGDVMIVIDGNPIDIPSKLFHAIFKEYKEEEINESDTKDLNVFFDAKTQFEFLTRQVKDMKRVGFSEENLKSLILESLPKDPGIQEFARKLIEEAYKNAK